MPYDWESAEILYRDPGVCITDSGIVNIPMSRQQTDGEPLQAGDRVIVADISSGAGMLLQRDLAIAEEE